MHVLIGKLGGECGEEEERTKPDMTLLLHTVAGWEEEEKMDDRDLAEGAVPEDVDGGRMPDVDLRGTDLLTRVLCPACRTQLIAFQTRAGPAWICACSHPDEYPGKLSEWGNPGMDLPAAERGGRRCA